MAREPMTVFDRMKVGGVKGRFFWDGDNIYKVLDLKRVGWEKEPLALEIMYAKPTASIPPRGPHVIPLSQHYGDTERTERDYNVMHRANKSVLLISVSPFHS